MGSRSSRRSGAGILLLVTTGLTAPQLPCHITRTNAETHRIIRAEFASFRRLFRRHIRPGPRYCPSIEDKVIRFADRDSHQIFLEPEGVDDPTVYPNGNRPRCRPKPGRLVATIPGLERARILRPGYAIEYDYIDPRGLDPTLQARRLVGPSWPGRSTARPATRRRRLKGSSPGSTRRAGPAGRRPRPSTAPNGTSA